MLLISALLTAGYLLPVVVEGFFPEKGEINEIRKERLSPYMTIPVLLLCAGALLTGLFGNEWIGGW